MGIKRGDGIGQRDRQGWQIFSELAGPFLLSRPDTTEPRMAVLMKPDDRLPVQWIRGSNVEQIIGGKRKRREWLSTFRLPVVSSSDRWWKRESASKRGETDEEDADKYYNSFIARMSYLKKKKNKGIILSKISSQSNFFAVRGRGENIYIIINYYFYYLFSRREIENEIRNENNITFSNYQNVISIGRRTKRLR